MAETAERVAVPVEVVDLAVQHHRGGAVLATDRLVTRLEVDDAQACHAERRPVVGMEADGVRAAVAERGDHVGEHRAIGTFPGRGHEAGDPAHRQAARTRTFSPAGIDWRASTTTPSPTQATSRRRRTRANESPVAALRPSATKTATTPPSFVPSCAGTKKVANAMPVPKASMTS